MAGIVRVLLAPFRFAHRAWQWWLGTYAPHERPTQATWRVLGWTASLGAVVLFGLAVVAAFRGEASMVAISGGAGTVAAGLGAGAWSRR